VPCAQLIHDRLAIEISRGAQWDSDLPRQAYLQACKGADPGEYHDLSDRALNSTGFSEISYSH
jgi:hypothetical protein